MTQMNGSREYTMHDGQVYRWKRWSRQADLDVTWQSQHQSMHSGCSHLLLSQRLEFENECINCLPLFIGQLLATVCNTAM